jgi:hypothetical protein
MLYGVAQSMLVRSTRCSWLKAWTLQVAGRCVTDDRVASSCRRHVRLGHKRTLGFWHVTDLAQCLTLVRDVLGFATPAEQFNACVASTA